MIRVRMVLAVKNTVCTSLTLMNWQHPHPSKAAFEIYSNSNEHLMCPLKYSYCVILVCAHMCKHLTTRGDKIHAIESKNVSISLAKSCCFATDWLQCGCVKKSHWYHLWPWQALKGLILPASVLSNSKADFNCQLLSPGGWGGDTLSKETDKEAGKQQVESSWQAE